MSQSSEFNYASPFSSMFVARSIKSPLEEMLNQPNTKLEDLLEDAQFIDEIRNYNARLIEYFTKSPERIKQLLDYIVQIPPDANDKKRAHLYPSVANDIFKEDITPIMILFFSQLPGSPIGGSPLRPPKEIGSEPSSPELNKGQGNDTQEESSIKPGDLLNYLFTFIDSKEELNNVLSGYFNTVVQKLLKRGQKKMIQHVYADEKILLKFVDHIGEFSISELIPMFLCYENYLFDDKNPEYLVIKMKVIEKIMDTLKDTNKPEAMTHIGDVLSEILLKNETMADGKEIMSKILSKETFDTLFGILKTSPSNAVILNIGNIIGVLLNQYTTKKTGFSAFGGFSPFLHISTDDSPVITSICENVEVLSKLLSEDKGKELFSAPLVNKPLGLGKLKVVEIFEKVMKLENRKIYAKVCESGIIQLVTDMFSKYIWNNMLHNIYERLFITIIDKKDGNLFTTLLEKANLVQIIIRDIKEDQFQLPKNSRKVRKGHMGHLTRIANELVTFAQMDRRVEEIVKKYPEWEQCVLPALKSQNDLNNQEIGGCHPRLIQAQLLGEGFAAPASQPSLRDSMTGLTLGGYMSTSQADQQATATEYGSPIHSKSPMPGGFLSTENASGPGGFSDAYSNLFAPINGSTLSYDSFQVTSTDPVKPTETATPATDIKPKPVEEPKPLENKPTPIVTVINSKDKIAAEEKNNSPTYNASELKVPEVKIDLSSPPHSPPTVSSPTLYEVKTVVTEAEKSSVPPGNATLSIPMREIKIDVSSPTLYEPKTETEKSSIPPPNNSNLVTPQNVADKNIINNGPQIPAVKQDAYSIFKDNKYSDMLNTLSTLKKSESVPIISSMSSVEDKSMRNSLNDVKKVKLKLKKADRFDGNKILNLINQYKGGNTSASFEFSYSENSQSECGNLVDEIEIQGPVLEPNGILSTFKN